MPACLIAYFSQAGSTAKVAESIGKGLLSNGYEVHLHSITDGPTPDFSSQDLIGFGSPVYNFSQPFNVVDFLRSLPRLDGKQAFVFNTYGTYNFDAGAQLVRLANSTGANVLGYFACYGWDSYLGYARIGRLFSGSHPDKRDLSNAESFGKQMAAKVTGETNAASPSIHIVSPPPIYRLERFFTNRWLTTQVYSRFFRVDESRCKRCGACLKVCPAANVGRNKSGLPVWHQRCIGCLMCELRCPQDAIRSPLPDWTIFRPFLRYNVRKASRDSHIEGCKARHSKGNIETI